MVTSLIQPSYQNNFYSPERGGITLRPNLWKGLVGCWKPSLGITGINTLRDISGYGNHGTMNGSMTIDDWVISAGGRRPAGYALDFDGVDDYIEVFDSKSLSITAELTISFWLNFKVDPTTTGNNIMFVDKQQPTNGDSYAAFFQQSENNMKLATFGANLGTTQTSWNVNQWYHFTGTFNDSADTMILYINGQQDNIDTSYVDTLLDTVDPVRIGNRPETANNAFNGLMDDIRIYNRVLSAQEVWDTYQFPNAMFQTRRVALGRPPDVGGETLTINVADCVSQETCLV